MEYVKLNWIVVSFLFLAIACSSEYDPQFSTCLKEAGKNKKELLRILEHYSPPNDSLKKKAAEFLIKNMPGHGSITSSWINSEGEEVGIDIHKYSNLKRLRHATDSLGYYQVINKKQEDCRHIQADLLIKNIDQAFEVWEKNTLGLAITFDEFCELLLPYRIGVEKLEDWRTPIRQPYKKVMDSLIVHSNTIKIPEIIHQIVSNYKYQYNDKAMALSHHQCFSEMMEYKVGTCEDIAQLGVITCRALGIPSAMDFIPMWGDINGGHARAMYMDKDNRMKIFGDEENMFKRPAKVFRRVFAFSNDLYTIYSNRYDIPPVLRDSRLVDATSDHCSCADVKFAVDSIAELDGEKCLFICIFNYGQWHPIFWSKVGEDKNLVFKDMGTDVIYRVGSFRKGKVKLLSGPFLLDRSGDLHYFETSVGTQDSIQMSAGWDLENNRGIKLKENEKYKLYCWEDGWKLLGEYMAINKSFQVKHDGKVKDVNKVTITLYDVPKEALLRVSNPFIENSARMFIVKDNGIRWY